MATTERHSDSARREVGANIRGAVGGRSHNPAAIVAMGTYEDVLVKTAEGWRFKTRTYYANAMPPSAIAAHLSN